MIKRATSDIKLIEKRFPKESKEFLAIIKELQPTDTDLIGAVAGLLRLQTIYKLKSEDFANGIIDGTKTREALSVHDLFVIGETALKLFEQEYFALEYLNLAWDRLQKGEDDNDQDIDEKSLLSHLASCYNQVGDYENAIIVVDLLIELDTNSTEFAGLKVQLEADHNKFGLTKLFVIDPFSDYYDRDGKFEDYKENILYSQVCRGNVAISHKEQAELYCRFVSTSPFTKLSPFKIEEANLDPYIVLFIDVISDQEIEFLKNITKPKVRRAEIYSSSHEELSSVRVAQLAWHHDWKHKEIEKLSKRVEAS